MSVTASQTVENLLARPEIHQQWEGNYRTADNERFYELAFDYLVRQFNAPAGATILDVGCGVCAHTVRLARRGYRVQAVDFSESALAMARDYLAAQGLSDQITLGRENLLDLSFPDESFDYLLCWGVLMHIPDVERAIVELARVVRPGGVLVVSEGNMSAPEALGLRWLKRILGREKATVKQVPAGVEYWKTKDNDALVTRQANIRWLIERFAAQHMRLRKRVAGQFSEAYAMTSIRPAKKLVHALNRAWFRLPLPPQLAYGNLLFFEKR